MRDAVESLLEDDHQSLGKLLGEVDGALGKAAIQHAFELLDLFWARLAVHIRAENLHLFPTLINAAPLFTGKDARPTFAEAQEAFARLRSDHDFFMKELAQMINVMRDMVRRESIPTEEVEELQRRLAVIEERLNNHNRLEEEQVYVWPSLLFDEQKVAELTVQLRKELENLPPRFDPGHDPLNHAK